ncbi:MAG: hypothetical protein AB3N18_08390 [Allomuricauda sp.]
MKNSAFLSALLILVFFSADRLAYVITKSTEKEVRSGLGVGKLNHFFKLKDSVDILVFGNSRASHHVNLNNVQSSSFNIGVDGSDIAYSTALVSSLKRKGQIILVHLDHNSLYNSTYNGDDVKALMYKLNTSEEIHEFFSLYFKKELVLSKLFKVYPYNGKLFPILKNKILPVKNPWKYKGYEPLFITKQQSIAFEKIRRKQNPPINAGIVNPIEISPLIEEFIGKIAETAKQNHSKLIFFTSPSLSKVDEEVRSKTNRFFKEKKIEYFDYIDSMDSIDSSIDKFWKDYTHLSDAGATIFSKVLEKDILEHIKD